MNETKSLIGLIILLFLFSSCSTHTTYVGPIQSSIVRNNSLNDQVAPGRSILYISQYGKGSGCVLYINKTEIGKVNYYNVLKVNVPAGKHKILCYFGGKATASWFKKYYESYKNIEMTALSGQKHSVFYRWRYNKSKKMNRPYLVVYHKPSVVNPYVKKRNLRNQKVTRIESNHQDVKENIAWNNTLNTNSISGYESFLRRYPYSPNASTARTNIDIIKKRERADFDLAMNKKSFGPAYKYMLDNPSSIYLSEAADKAIDYNKKIKRKKTRLKNYQSLANINRAYIDRFPKPIQYDMKLKSVGPNDFNVGKIINMKKEGLSPSIIAAKVLATNKPYKNFEIEEIKYLKKKGLNDSIIEAMLKSTANYDNQVKQVQQNKEMMAQIQKLIKNSQKQNTRSNTRRSYRSNVRKPASYNKPQSQVGSCLKRKLALDACRKVGGFMKSACEITAKSTYPCNIR